MDGAIVCHHFIAQIKKSTREYIQLYSKLTKINLTMVMRHEVAPFCVTCQFGLSQDILTFELEYFLK